MRGGGIENRGHQIPLERLTPNDFSVSASPRKKIGNGYVS